MRSYMLAAALAGCAALSACSSEPAAKEPVKAARPPQRKGIAKYIELAGFRPYESGPGKLKITLTAINHSEADLGEVTMKVKVTTTTAKPEDPPVAEFEARVSLGPQDSKDVSATTSTKLRVYELPDWQFLKADFEVTSPQD